MGAARAEARIVMPPPPGWSNDEMGHKDAVRLIDFAAG